MILHVPRSDIHKGRLLVLDFVHIRSSKRETILWLFGTLVTSTLLYGIETWELSPSLGKANNWKES